MPQVQKPEGVVPSDPAVQLFGKIIASAYNQMMGLVEESKLAGIDDARRRALMSQVSDIIAQTDLDTQAWIKTMIPAMYEDGLFQATKEMHEAGLKVNISPSFARFHTQAIEALSREMYAETSQGLQGLSKTMAQLLSTAQQAEVAEQIGKGIVTGDSLRKINKNVKSTLADNGIDGIVDKAGRTWSLSRYSEMLARTKLTQVHNTGLTNRLIESGYDLVIVSNHFGSCDRCAPYENKVLSMTGRTKGYMGVDEATAGGLFHPNCRHRLLPYSSEYLNVAQVWDTEQKKYVPYSEYSIQNTSRAVTLYRGDGKRFNVGGDTFQLTPAEMTLQEKKNLKIGTGRDVQDAYGWYSPDNKTLTMNTRLIKAGGQNASQTFYHEFGHFIDHELYGDKGEKRITASAEWTAIDVAQKRAMVEKRILTAAGGDEKKQEALLNLIETMYTDPAQEVNDSLKKFAAYLMSDREVFADAYGWYRTDPQYVKDFAPDIYKLFEKISK